MFEIALLGFGTVGKSTYTILEEKTDEIASTLGEKVKVSKILVRTLRSHEKIEEEIFTNNFEDILNDDKISLVCEMTGDLSASYHYIKSSLEAKKHVVTSNKAVISEHFKEFNDLAEKMGVNFLFEASVGGSIPIIGPLKSQRLVNNIHRLRGILNGTSNYILSKMYFDGTSYEDVLDEAKKLGYAESDPYEDVEGVDALRKLKILSSIAYGKDIDNDEVICQGISSILPIDIKYFQHNNLKVKLIAESFLKNNRYALLVEPVIVDVEDPFYSVDGSNNIVEIFGENYSNLSFVGEGAGGMPTANAVVIDVIEALKGDTYKINLNKKPINSGKSFKGRYYLRLKSNDLDSSYIDSIKTTGDYKIIITKEIERSLLFKDLESLKKEDYFIARFERKEE
ncbi:homoserine dehydrogenase [Peptoniphilus catoniae]|uniref:homoserine dehydrogenase n=1 Tax=Peptoniphilus catoniae TaxID=1660341 RepID=UPI0010FDB425|nr:homoserine dehydrogenase [Peptoniphilus catoniae]